MTLAFSIIDRSLQEHPYRPAIVGEDVFLTYWQLAEQIDRAAWGLREKGCGPGERVLLALPDSTEFVVALFGAWKAGAVPVPVSPFVDPNEYARYLNDLSFKCAVGSADVLDKLPAGDFSAIAVGADGKYGPSWQELLELSPKVPFPAPDLDPNGLALLLYTSGSTSLQKCVMHSHHTIVSACQNIATHLFHLTPSDRVQSIPKPFFAWGLGGGVLFPLFTGSTCIVGGGRLEMKQTIELIRKHRPTTLIAVPTFLSILLQSQSWMNIDLSSVRHILSAGEPLKPSIFYAFKQQGIDVYDGIGSTEMFTHFISTRPGKCYPGTCGIEAPGYEALLVGDNDQPVPDGQIGGLLVRGPTSFLGYWRNPEATMRARKAEWVRTGDNLYRDSGGMYHYCGRSDDMLKIGGMWALPLDVENAICRHENIVDAVVTARDDNRERKRLVAYVVPRPGAAPDVSDLLRFVGDRVPSHMIPAAFIVMDTIPRTPNGKVNRSALPDPDWLNSQVRATENIRQLPNNVAAGSASSSD